MEIDDRHARCKTGETATSHRVVFVQRTDLPCQKFNDSNFRVIELKSPILLHTRLLQKFLWDYKDIQRKLAIIL